MEEQTPAELRRILSTEFSEEFVEAMRRRMVTSFYKYGPVAEGYPDRVAALASMRQRLDKYLETGNTEFLVDAANFLMIEFMFPSKEGAHYTPGDSDDSPGRTTRKGRVDHRGNHVVHRNPHSSVAEFLGGQE